MKYVAFLRGINVGGHNKIKMEILREMFAALGFKNVKTYINSGNVIFETAETSDDKLAAKIEKAIESEFSLDIKVMTRTVFLAEELSEEKRNLLLSNNNEFEMFAVRNREVFCLLRGRSILDSLLGKKYVDNKLKTSVTGRNWRTINKIMELLLK